MTDVIAWPPVSLTGWEITRSEPVSRSVGLIQGGRRTSAALKPRRLATAVVLGRGQDQAGAGYVEMLKAQLAGGVHLVRVECSSAVWQLARAEALLHQAGVDWTASGVTLNWTSGGVDLIWGAGQHALTGAPATDGDWDAIAVSGLPPSRIVARPSERISVTDGASTETATVLTVARSDASGDATIRLDSAIALAGAVRIGETASIVFEALEMPRAVQAARGRWAYTWEFREVFEAESPGGWTEVDPWR